MSSKPDVVAVLDVVDAELLGFATDLGDEEPALDSVHGRGGERGGVVVFAQLATGSHAGEAVAQVRFPAVEAGGDRRSSVWVALRELAGERAERATAARLPADLMLDE